MIGNNSTNINKMHNNLSPHIIEFKNKTMTYDVRNPGPALGQPKNVNLVNRIQTLSLKII
jgi:hypothetical protein